MQGGHPPPPIVRVYLVPLAKSHAHGAASQTGIESGHFGSDQGIFCSSQGVFLKTPQIIRAFFLQKTPRIELVLNPGPKSMDS